jgi:Protein of unknown function (DUF2721)
MELSIQTPALLFPALSLLLLAYTNKFLAIANLIRTLYSDYEATEEPLLLPQIYSLRRRLFLIRFMQVAGIASIFFCVVTMLAIYYGQMLTAKLLFLIALLLLMGSLVISVVEVIFSAGALNVLLKDLEQKRRENKRKRVQSREDLLD